MLIVGVIALGFVACGKKNDDQPQVVAAPTPAPTPPPAPQCQPGQNCNPTPTCPAGQYIVNNQCVVVPAPIGNQHFLTNLMGLDTGISRKIIEVYYGFCWGFGNFCPDKSQAALELKLYGSGSAMTANMFLYVGSNALNNGGVLGFAGPVITISGQPQHFVINSDKGSELMLQHAGWKFHVRTSDVRLDNPIAAQTNVNVEVLFTDVLKTTPAQYGTGSLQLIP